MTRICVTEGIYDASLANTLASHLSKRLSVSVAPFRMRDHEIIASNGPAIRSSLENTGDPWFTVLVEHLIWCIGPRADEIRRAAVYEREGSYFLAVGGGVEA